MNDNTTGVSLAALLALTFLLFVMNVSSCTQKGNELVIESKNPEHCDKAINR